MLLSGIYNILHFYVNVNAFLKGGIQRVERIALAPFGKDIETRLIALGESHEWLIKQVAEATGLYFDRSYLNKIKVGQLNTPGVVQAIREILNIPDAPTE